MNSTKRLMTISLTLLVLVFAFQNCADHQGMDLGDESSSYQASTNESDETQSSSDNLLDQACLLNPYFSDMDGSELFLASGKFIEAYSAQSVTAGTACVSEKRYCQNGQLSGSFKFSRCVVQQSTMLPCMLNGSVINHGQAVIAYEKSSVAPGGMCQGQSRVCQNGVLTGEYLFSSCSVQNSTTCSFSGQTVANGATVTAYMLTKDSQGNPVCLNEQRVCNNGFLTGSYVSSHCQVVNAGCSFNGVRVLEGQSVLAYHSGVVAAGTSCQSEYRTCRQGLLSGSYLFSSCSVASGGGGGGGGGGPGRPPERPPIQPF